MHKRLGRFGAMTKADSSGPMNVSSFGMLVSGSWSEVWHAVPEDSCMTIHFICGQKGRHWRKRWNELQVQFEWDKVLMFVVLHQSQKNVRCDIQQIGSRPKPGLRFCHQSGVLGDLVLTNFAHRQYLLLGMRIRQTFWMEHSSCLQ